MQSAPGVAPRSYRVPIVVLSVLLFLLVGAIVVVQASRAGERAALRCSVGEWDVGSYRDAVQVPPFPEPVIFTGGAGTILRLRADGTGEIDYGTRVRFTAEAPDGRPIWLEVGGPLRFDYELRPGSIFVTPTGNDATSQLFIDGTRVGSPAKFRDEGAEGRSYRLTCAGDSLTQDDGVLVVGYRRR
ncbi:hypothetical protein Ais01nite_79200 [Asanoa ishikariensis]|uniref:Uncharacterized protein n=1 Tax=Asanoa ishikariensis TaxID=137265 RepID=A0A1H3KH67_9ACTN|nr:hypothetical protein [Asanoa ishikariensis]GIF69885.1 hypothetical protein Ais01nite_79200 [Asanoa ishikariensis]SDY51552.1 hypothetical protein SAMN05421684_0146 [Asanoa ishikariensis]